MTSRLPMEIKTPEDIARFFTHLVVVEGLELCLPPFQSFSGYSHREGVWIARTYTDRQADFRDRLMAQAITVAAENGLDIEGIVFWAHYLGQKDLQQNRRRPAITDYPSERLLFDPDIPGVLDWMPKDD